MRGIERQNDLRFYLGVAQQRSGDLAKGLANFETIVKSDPQHLLAINSVAWVRSTHPDPQFRDGERASQLALALCQKTKFGNPSFLMTLAAAQAESGNFQEAVSSIRLGSIHQAMIYAK